MFNTLRGMRGPFYYQSFISRWGRGANRRSGGPRACQKKGNAVRCSKPHTTIPKLLSQIWVSENTGGDITLSSFLLWRLRARQTERWMELKQKSGNVCKMSSERYVSCGQDKLNIKPFAWTVALFLRNFWIAPGQKTHKRHEISNRTFSLQCCEPIM